MFSSHSIHRNCVTFNATPLLARENYVCVPVNFIFSQIAWVSGQLYIPLLVNSEVSLCLVKM
jgi:hypothetical protein